MSAEIEPDRFKCNACWKTVEEGTKTYRTRCNHLFCLPCATRFFSKAMTCPVCERDVDGDGGVLEVTPEKSFDIMAGVFSFVVMHPDLAFTVMGEATKFCREQVALYGTREIYIRSKEAERLSDMLAATQRNAAAAAEEGERYRRRAEALAGQVAEKERALANLQDMYSDLKAMSSMGHRRGSGDDAPMPVGGGHGRGEGLGPGPPGAGMTSTPRACMAPLNTSGSHGSGLGLGRIMSPVTSSAASASHTAVMMHGVMHHSLQRPGSAGGMTSGMRGGGVPTTPAPSMPGMLRPGVSLMHGPKRTTATPAVLGHDPTSAYMHTAKGTVKVLQRPPTGGGGVPTGMSAMAGMASRPNASMTGGGGIVPGGSVITSSGFMIPPPGSGR